MESACTIHLAPRFVGKLYLPVFLPGISRFRVGLFQGLRSFRRTTSELTWALPCLYLVSDGKRPFCEVSDTHISWQPQIRKRGTASLNRLRRFMFVSQAEKRMRRRHAGHTTRAFALLPSHLTLIPIPLTIQDRSVLTPWPMSTKTQGGGGAHPTPPETETGTQKVPSRCTRRSRGSPLWGGTSLSLIICT